MRIRATVVLALASAAAGMRAGPADEIESGMARVAEPVIMVPAMEHPDLAPRLRELALANARAWLANPLLEIRQDPPAARRLGEIRVPVLVVIGDRDVPHMQKVADKLTAEVAGSKKVVIRGAGHITNMEKPQEFDSAGLEFLKAQPAAR